MFNDLREFLKKADELGQCQVIEGADWNLEIGQITELQLSVPDAPLLIFDKIKGYKPGYRVVSNFLNTPKLFNLVFDLPLEVKGLEQVKVLREKVKAEFKPVPPVEVKTGPVLENVDTGDKVDIFKFPTPKWHEHDGGRYIGTACMVINRDPDEGWVNLGAYRVQIHDKNTATIYMSPGRHGDVIRRKYWERGQSCPVAVVCGGEPLLWCSSTTSIPPGVSEYDHAGWVGNKPVEVVKGRASGLPIPATAEIVLDGEIMPPGTETREEGPFGEWSGYYASGARDESAFKVKAVMYRNDPIILGGPPLVGSHDFNFGMNIRKAAILWNELDKQVPGVKGVWMVDEARPYCMAVISIEQKYGGHAKQAAMFAAGHYVSAYMRRYIIVVDDDIDPSNMADVFFALGTRCDPEIHFDIVRGCYGTPLDAVLPPDKRNRKDFTHSTVLINACKPYYWMKEFPLSVKTSPEVLQKTRAKWRKVLFGQA